VIGLFFLLLGGHALADGPLQGPVMSAGKVSKHPCTRLQYLAQHGLIHGLVVALLTHVWWMGALETVAHMAIDAAKGSRLITHVEDQALHVVCKLVWCLIVFLL
jgi:hypothetical protein